MVAVGVGVAVGRRAHTLGAPEHEYPLSVWQESLQPSPEISFSSSQLSDPEIELSPQVDSLLSHVLLKLVSRQQAEPAVGQYHPPLSVWQESLQPSPAVAFPSSQVSDPKIELSPQVDSLLSHVLLKFVSRQQAEPAVGQ
jgi:hypothetical protein